MKTTENEQKKEKELLPVESALICVLGKHILIT